MNTGIYEIANVDSGKRYVGSAVNLSQRWNEHRSLLRRGGHHARHLQAAWNKYGESAFQFRPLIACAKADLLLYEQIAIDCFDPDYNACRFAGSTLGRTHSPETRAKIAARALGRKRNPESVERGAAKRRGVPLSREHAAKLIGNKHALGMKHTAERKAQISIEQTGRKRPKDAAYRAKISASLKGRPRTPEQRAAQSAGQLCKKRGPYTKRSLDA